MDTRKFSRRTDAVLDKLLTALERAADELDAVTRTRREKVKTDTGEINTEITERVPGETGLIDRAALKQLTSVLRDLQSLTESQPELTRREQTLRLRQLERSLDECEGQLTIRLEEPTDAFAE